MSCLIYHTDTGYVTKSLCTALCCSMSQVTRKSLRCLHRLHYKTPVCAVHSICHRLLSNPCAIILFRHDTGYVTKPLCALHVICHRLLSNPCAILFRHRLRHKIPVYCFVFTVTGYSQIPVLLFYFDMTQVTSQNPCAVQVICHRLISNPCAVLNPAEYGLCLIYRSHAQFPV